MNIKIYSKDSEEKAIHTTDEHLEEMGITSRKELLEVIDEVEVDPIKLKYWAQSKMYNPGILRHIADVGLGREVEPLLLCEDNYKRFQFFSGEITDDPDSVVENN